MSDDRSSPEDDAASDGDEDPTTGGEGSTIPDRLDPAAPGGPGSERGDDLEESSAGADLGGSEPDPDAPLGDLAASLEDRQASGEPPEGVFTEEEVPEIDADVVWERLEEDEHEPEPVTGPEPDVRVVPANEYCEQCPFFSEPPDVHCTHEGTQIQALVDMDHFRVVDCPKVAENERLENL